MKKILQGFLWVLLMIGSHAYAQTRTVTGTVTSKDDGLPLPGVTVRATGTTISTQTNGQGKFSLSVPTTARALDFVYIGYATLTGSIDANNTVNVSLSADTKQLNEVIVTAAGLASSRRSQGVNITTVKAEQLTQAKSTTIAGGLLGKVPGLQINGTTGGTNPNFRIVLRGARSLLGTNEALIVLDNVIVPNAVLNNLNPEDVEDVQVLNGASAAALYGSDASNGALVVRTKKGKKGQIEVKAQQTISVENVAFYPKLQNQFGSGSDNDLQLYLGYENQQYGPAFDGVTRQLGLPVLSATGPVQQVPYSATNAKNDFWDTGLTSQSDLSLSSGDDKGTLFMSGQYVNTRSVMPKDKFNRGNFRVGGTRNWTDKLSSQFSVGYTQNRYDQTTQTAGIYGQVLATPAQAPLTSYQDWQNDPFANPNGYYNAYLQNPYWTIDNYREKIRNDYLTGSADLKFSPVKWMDLTYRLGFSTRNVSSKSYSDKFAFSDYAKSQPETAGTYKRVDIVGGVTDASSYNTRITNEIQASFRKQVSDFNFNLVVIGNMRQDRSKALDASVSGLVQPGLFNLGNSTNPPTAGEANYLYRQQAISGLLTIKYKDYLTVNASGRNDWDSRLIKDNRSFFYPAINAAFILTDAVDFFKSVKQLDYIKLRGGYAKVGLVNTGATGFGAYQLQSTFSQGSGFPYNGLGGLTLDNRTVSNNLTPEFTKGYEVGIDAGLYSNRIVANVTYYDNTTTNQTVTAPISNTTGYTTFLVNGGKTSGKGLETNLSLTPVRTKDFELTVGANYSHYNNKTIELYAGLPNIAIASYTGGAGAYAIAGQPLPVIQARQYVRDPQGRIIVNSATGYPSGTSTTGLFGSSAPTDIIGLTLNANYKGLNLSAVGEYRGGYNVYNSVSTGFDFYGSGLNTVAYNRQRFVIPNSSYLNAQGQYVANTNITVRDGGAAYWTIAGPRTAIDENYVTNGAFWKIREITLSYTIPQSLLSKSKFIRSAKISAQGRNLFIFLPKSAVYTDPEYSAGDGTGTGNGVGLNSTNTPPPSRYFGGTLSLTF
ncbi:SusC/RagA family TonB-linked outer membrane protein [Mucilaginibacter terrae]|uniref:SusC/RagA family TonB-linked outer membrane protein n=1 Tax=Mucilaginibacter terrae TaxID=1955052 RepID=UPI0036428E43